MSARTTLATFASCLVLLGPAAASAQYFDDSVSEHHEIGSPEGFALELRIGPYEPDDANIGSLYDDEGPLLAFEFDVMFLPIPYVGRAGLGFGLGWSRYTAKAATVAGEETQEELAFVIVPMTGVAVLRIDVLARELNIPFIFTGKLGLDAISWDSNRGETDEDDGITFGLHWAAQVALELDFFDRQAARALDEEWGINHTFLFFEYFGAEARGAPVVGDRTWSAGLGFLF